MNFTIINKEFSIERKVLIIGALTLIMAFIIVVFFFYLNKDSKDDVVLSSLVNNPTSTQKASPNNTNLPRNNQTNNEISVYVRGCVKSPGIVKIYKGQIIADAIEQAGGLTPEADIDNINLVYVLNENVMLKINPKGYVKSDSEDQQNSFAGSKDLNFVGKGVEISKETEGILRDEEKKSSDSSKDNKIAMININSASEEDFDTLPGIGPKKAYDIVDFRKKNGNFKSIESIMDVSGIGESAFTKIKEYIYV